MRERLYEAVYETLRTLETSDVQGSDEEVAEATEAASRLLERVRCLTQDPESTARTVRSADP